MTGQSRFARGIRREDLRDVEFVGSVPREHRSSFLADADVFCYASRYESYGLPILEAALAGLPLVASRVGIVPEIVGSGDGILADLGAPTIAGVCEDLLSRLSAAQEWSARRATRLRPWARWDARIEDVRCWLEQGECEPSPPPLNP